MTNSKFREGRSRGLPAMMLMAVIFVIGLTLTLSMTQSAYADEYDDVRFVMVDEHGNVISDGEGEYDNLLYKGSVKHLRLDIPNYSEDMIVKEPEVTFDDGAGCYSGWQYDDNTHTLTVDGTELWNRCQQAGSECVRITSEVVLEEEEGYELTVGSACYDFYLKEETIERDNLAYDIVELPLTAHVFPTETYVMEYSASHPEGLVHDVRLTKMTIKSSDPVKPGREVIEIDIDSDCYNVYAKNEGRAVVEAVYAYDKNKTLIQEFTVDVVPEIYTGHIYSLAYVNSALPGGEIQLEANAEYETKDGDIGTDGLTCEWTIKDNEDEANTQKFFSIEPDGHKATVKFKTKNEIANAFPEEDVNDLLSRIATVKLTVRKNGQVVAEDETEIIMETSFYQIGDPTKWCIEVDENNRSAEIDLRLWEHFLGNDGNPTRRQVDKNKVEYSLPESEYEYDSNIEFDWRPGSETGTLTISDWGGQTTIHAYMRDEDGDRMEVAVADVALEVTSSKLGKYSINTRKTIYPVEGFEGELPTEKIGLQLNFNDHVLDPEKYEVLFHRCYYDSKKDEYVFDKGIEGPLGIHEEDREDGETTYSISIKPKEGSGLSGEIKPDDENTIRVWNKYLIDNDWSTELSIEQKEVDWEDYGDDYPFGKYDDILLDIKHQRFAAGIKEKPVLEMRDKSILDRDHYTIKYYKRSPKDTKPEKNIKEADLLPGFPTETGTYIAVAEGIAPYTGKTYLAFDLTESLKSATVTGVASKTYTGKRLRQDMKKVKVTLNGKTLIDGVDYEISYDNNIKVGKNTAKMYVRGINKYSGKAIKKFTIKKGKNTLKASGKTCKLKAKKLKKKNQTITKAKAYKISKNKGKVTFKKVGLNKKKFNKKFTVNAKTGKITVKKGVKKGTYKLKVKVTAAGNKSYNKLTKTVTVTIKVR